VRGVAAGAFAARGGLAGVDDGAHAGVGPGGAPVPGRVAPAGPRRPAPRRSRESGRRG
jgi:hypothetical protein